MPKDLEVSALAMVARDWEGIRKALFTDDGNENFVVLFCGYSADDGSRRLLVREWWSASPADYYTREAYHLEISPAYLNKVVDYALATGLSPVVLHSHPGATLAKYSSSDDFGEKRLLPVLSQLLPGMTPASLLASENEVIGRTLVGGRFQLIRRISTWGDTIEHHDALPSNIAPSEEVARQVLAWGEVAQSRLQQLRVTIVGLGGTGSAVAEQLARMGVRNLRLVDPDVVDRSNLSRIWGATPEDVGRPKVEVVAGHLRRIVPHCEVTPQQGNVTREQVLKQLASSDLIFGCTDNHWSRAVLNRLSHQYLVPVVDVGTRLDARAGRVTAAAGRVSIVGPGATCLICSGVVDPVRVRAESLATAERERLAQEGYVQGAVGPVPSVITLNSTVASLGVTTGLSLFVNMTGAPPAAELRYDASTGATFTAHPRHLASCEHCSPKGGVKALGSLQLMSAFD